MRTIHKDFITSSPVPEVESQYRYDRSLYSSWSYPSYAGEYCNYWGYGRPVFINKGGAMSYCLDDGPECL